MEFPELLFECCYTEKVSVCLICGKGKAETALRSVESGEIIPMCRGCGSGWNAHGYYFLKRIKPKELLKNIFFYKLTHFRPSWWRIWKGIKKLQAWSVKMKKFERML